MYYIKYIIMETKSKEGEKKASGLFKFSGDWEKQSNALKVKFPKLTAEDVKFESGKELDLIKRLETKLQKNRFEVVSILKSNYSATTKAVL
jgi:hypothetical protein